MAGLKTAKCLHINFPGHAVVVNPTFDPQDISLPRVLTWRSNPTVAELAVIALDDKGMYV